MNRKNLAILLDLVGVLVLLLYVLSLNPTTYTYLKHHIAATRYRLWMLTHPGWLKEAMVVRGTLSE